MFAENNPRAKSLQGTSSASPDKKQQGKKSAAKTPAPANLNNKKRKIEEISTADKSKGGIATKIDSFFSKVTSEVPLEP